MDGTIKFFPSLSRKASRLFPFLGVGFYLYVAICYFMSFYGEIDRHPWLPFVAGSLAAVIAYATLKISARSVALAFEKGQYWALIGLVALYPISGIAVFSTAITLIDGPGIAAADIDESIVALTNLRNLGERALADDQYQKFINRISSLKTNLGIELVSPGKGNWCGVAHESPHFNSA
ncbi:MAG: hypothetical protein NT133_14760 [Alphaproteobacteria bacterium]|nr:hypothetical protein [Alphaproteobacteria bacterium]